MLLLAQKSGIDGLAAHTRFCPERHARDARTKSAVARAVVARAPVDEDAKPRSTKRWRIRAKVRSPILHRTTNPH